MDGLNGYGQKARDSMERLTQTSDKGGVTFTFDLYINCLPSEAEKILKVAEKLKEYEDLEEQGLILRLPCRVGTIVYVLQSDRIIKVIITRYDCFKDGSIWFCFNHGCGKSIAEFGKTVFLTREEAEAKLKETEGADGK